VSISVPGLLSHCPELPLHEACRLYYRVCSCQLLAKLQVLFPTHIAAWCLSLWAFVCLFVCRIITVEVLDLERSRPRLKGSKIETKAHYYISSNRSPRLVLETRLLLTTLFSNKHQESRHCIYYCRAKLLLVGRS